MCKFAIFGRINSIDAVTEERYGFRTGIQRPFMRGRVDALRQTTDNTKTGSCQVVGEFIRILYAAPVGFRLPTIASAGRCSASMLPTTYKRVGGPGICRSSSGISPDSESIMW